MKDIEKLTAEFAELAQSLEKIRSIAKHGDPVILDALKELAKAAAELKNKLASLESKTPADGPAGPPRHKLH